MGTNLPTILPYLSFSISSILHPFSTHDDTILPTYPIKLFLLPIIYDDAYPPASSLVAYNPSLASSTLWSTTPSSSCPWSTTRATAVRGVQPQPAAARGIQYTASAGRAGGRGGGPRRGGEREETLRKVRMYSMAGIFPPCSCTASRQGSGHVSADPEAV